MSLFEKRADKPVEFSFQHGIYLDYWSLVHFLSGIVLGGVFLLIADTNLLVTTALIFLLAVLYEALEILLHIAEDIENVVVDILLVTVGGVISTMTLQAASITVVIAISGVTLIAAMILLRVGWKRYLKRKLQQTDKS